MPVNNNRNQGVDSTEVIENYGKITGGAHNFGKIADSGISLSLPFWVIFSNPGGYEIRIVGVEGP